MKQIVFLLLAVTSFIVRSQESPYSISSYKDEGTKAPNTHYIGEARLNSLLRADGDLTYNITKATFRANSTLAWHMHEPPQVLVVV